MRNYIGHFSLWGDFEPGEITKGLNLQPSAIYPKGELWEGGQHPAKSTTWDVHCPRELTAAEQINFLLDLLNPSAEMVRRFSELYTAELNVSCEGESVVSLGAKELQELATLRVKLNLFVNDAEADNAD